MPPVTCSNPLRPDRANESSPRGVRALLHNKSGSIRPPECRLKIFSRFGQLEQSLNLEEVMEQASPTAAFTCLKPHQGRFDRAHLSFVLRYYFVLQKLQLHSPWPINDIFISELKAACRVAKASVENPVLEPKSQELVTVITARISGASTRPQDTALPQVRAGLICTERLQADMTTAW